MIHVAPDATSNQGGRHVFHNLEGLAPYVYTESSSLWDCGMSEAGLRRMAEFSSILGREICFHRFFVCVVINTTSIYREVRLPTTTSTASMHIQVSFQATHHLKARLLVTMIT